MTPEKAVERVIKILQSCKQYFFKEDEQAIDIAIQLLKEGEIYMTAEDFNLYLEGYKQGKKDFERPKGEWEKCQNGMFRCSNCRQADEVPTAMGTPIYNFCPNCGADMRDKKK